MAAEASEARRPIRRSQAMKLVLEEVDQMGKLLREADEMLILVRSLRERVCDGPVSMACAVNRKRASGSKK